MCFRSLTASGKAGAVTPRVTSPFSHTHLSRKTCFLFPSNLAAIPPAAGLPLSCSSCAEGLTGEGSYSRRASKWIYSPIPPRSCTPPSSSQTWLGGGKGSLRYPASQLPAWASVAMNKQNKHHLLLSQLSIRPTCHSRPGEVEEGTDEAEAMTQG